MASIVTKGGTDNKAERRVEGLEASQWERLPPPSPYKAAEH